MEWLPLAAWGRWDSAGACTTCGTLLENHEMTSLLYNNIIQTATSLLVGGPSPVVDLS